MGSAGLRASGLDLFGDFIGNRSEGSGGGVVAFYTHEIPEFSFFDLRRNVQEGVIAMAMAVALPSSVDNLIYLGNGICCG